MSAGAEYRWGRRGHLVIDVRGRLVLAPRADAPPIDQAEDRISYMSYLMQRAGAQECRP